MRWGWLEAGGTAVRGLMTKIIDRRQPAVMRGAVTDPASAGESIPSGGGGSGVPGLQ